MKLNWESMFSWFSAVLMAPLVELCQVYLHKAETVGSVRILSMASGLEHPQLYSQCTCVFKIDVMLSIYEILKKVRRLPTQDLV